MAKYGFLNKITDVTDIIINKLTNNDKILVSDIFKNNDPYYGKISSLTIYLKDGNKINALQNTTLNRIYNIEPIINSIPTTDIIELSNSNMNNYIVSTNVRDESNILEWIVYHLLIGFDKVVIIDHKSQIPVLQLIQQYSWKNKVHVIRREDEGPVKIKFLNEIIVPYMMVNCKKYFIHLDADEYIYIKNNNINDFLLQYNADILVMHWLMFGNNNLEKNTHPNKFLIPMFTKSSNILHTHFKCFIKVQRNKPFIFVNPHTIKYTNKTISTYMNVINKTSNKINYNELINELSIDTSIDGISGYINHYYVQSREDYMKRKVNRNRDDISAKRELEDNIFEKYNNITNTNLIKYNDSIYSHLSGNSFGFIILRHVRCANTNKLWINCYESIRRLYNNMIVIIDDNSNKTFITEHPIVNTTIISSEYPQRGELLPYYYMIKNKLFKRAIVLHDSMEMKKYYNFNNISNYKNYTRLFSFGNDAYKIDIEYFREMCNYINNGNILYRYHMSNINKLIGCFGVCYIVDLEFLNNIERKYRITNLVKFIDNRKKRMCLERFLSCLFEYDRGKQYITCNDLFGSIYNNKGEYIIKTFHGR